MADQGKWWKLWCSSLSDDELENLSIHEWFAWARFGAHLKAHGKDGKITLRSPATAVVNLLRVPNFDEVVSMLKRFPNFIVETPVCVTVPDGKDERTVLVKVKNWNKYQGDWSRDRVRKHRLTVTAKVTAQEEKRREVEEKRKEEITPKQLSAPNGAVSELMGIFHIRLTEALGEKPPTFNAGSLGRTLKAALQTHGVEDVKERIENWFRSTDPFVVSNGYSPTLFTSKFPLLKGGPIHALKNNARRGDIGIEAPAGKYASITENG